MSVESSDDFGERVLNSCRELGVEAAGIFDWAHPETQDTYAKAIQHYESWLKKNFHGPMGYLERGLARRQNPLDVFPNLKSILAIAIPYETQRRTEFPKFSRYLQGRDYHIVVRSILEQVLSRVGILEKGKICVDTSAVMERTFGAMAGLGWIGKNTMLIHPKLGSYFFIGVAFLEIECGRGPRWLPNYCGNCSRCLKGCPTDAFVQPHVLDSKRCISCFTLENRDLKATSELHGWVAGCDICQEVCPFNHKPFREHWVGSETIGFETYPSTEWTNLTENLYEVWRKKSALERVRFHQMQRNIKLALKPPEQKA